MRKFRERKASTHSAARLRRKFERWPFEVIHKGHRRVSREQVMKLRHGNRITKAVFCSGNTFYVTEYLVLGPLRLFKHISAPKARERYNMIVETSRKANQIMFKGEREFVNDWAGKFVMPVQAMRNWTIIDGVVHENDGATKLVPSAQPILEKDDPFHDWDIGGAATLIYIDTFLYGMTLCARHHQQVLRSAVDLCSFAYMDAARREADEDHDSLMSMPFPDDYNDHFARDEYDRERDGSVSLDF